MVGVREALILGQVVGVHIDPTFLKGGLFDIAAGTIARCGYRGDYGEASSVFEMLRPARLTLACARPRGKLALKIRGAHDAPANGSAGAIHGGSRGNPRSACSRHTRAD
jgi:hypothetical protein